MPRSRTREPHRPPHRRRTAAAPLAAGALVLVLLATAGLLAGCGDDAAAGGDLKVIVLGFDGMDHALTTELMEAGRLPNLSRLADMGGFQPLGTSVPPQSPVAWSNFITGMDSGGHGIYDFVHRDPDTLRPYLSTSLTHEPERFMELGPYRFPLDPGGTELLRHGTPFWEVLEEHGVETTIVRMPANYPPSGTATRELSGMGTPDLMGSYGTFSFYTSELFYDPDVSGGEVYDAWPEDGVVRAELYGPQNPFVADGGKMTTEFAVHIDPEEPVAKLVVGDEERVLEVGEWTDWVPVTFELMPTQSVNVMARFFLKSLEPEFQLYVTPFNFDPLAPATAVSHPEGYAEELARGGGERYYTQGMPEDTQALKGGILTREEFLAQAKLTRVELERQYRYVLEQFDRGLLFYYMGNADQVSHMLWDALDPSHPAYDPEEDAPLADVIPKIYEELDAMVGYTLEHMPENTLLVVMSDHGFTSWKRSFHLNTWLRREGYLALTDPGVEEDSGLFTYVDWSRTRAYGLGINGLYVNLEGRERDGIVAPEEKAALVQEIGDKLLAVVDPKTGGPAVTRVYPRDEFYQDTGHLEIGPDLVIGYAKGTRNSSESALGELTREVFSDNLTDWPGDHLMDHTTVPGILLTNRPLKQPAPDLESLAPALLAEYGIGGFPRAGGGDGDDDD